MKKLLLLISAFTILQAAPAEPITLPAKIGSEYTIEIKIVEAEKPAVSHAFITNSGAAWGLSINSNPSNWVTNDVRLYRQVKYFSEILTNWEADVKLSRYPPRKFTNAWGEVMWDEGQRSTGTIVSNYVCSIQDGTNWVRALTTSTNIGILYKEEWAKEFYEKQKQQQQQKIEDAKRSGIRNGSGLTDQLGSYLPNRGW